MSSLAPCRHQLQVAERHDRHAFSLRTRGGTWQPRRWHRRWALV